MLAIFFVVLAVFDEFEEEEGIEYYGEFISETDFDFLDFPDSISRPTGTSKVNKLERNPIHKFFDGIFDIITPERLIYLSPSPEIPKLFSGYNPIISNSICANAP